MDSIIRIRSKTAKVDFEYREVTKRVSVVLEIDGTPVASELAGAEIGVLQYPETGIMEREIDKVVGKLQYLRDLAMRIIKDLEDSGYDIELVPEWHLAGDC